MKKLATVIFAVALGLISIGSSFTTPSAYADNKTDNIAKAAAQQCKDNKGTDKQRCENQWVSRLKALKDDDIPKSCASKNGSDKYTCTISSLVDDDKKSSDKIEAQQEATRTASGNCPATGCLGSASKLGIPVLGGGGDQFAAALKSIVTILGIISGIVSVVFLALGGVNYASSGGDPGRVANAKNMLLYAIIGLVVSVLAPFIVSFAIARGPQ